MPLIYLVLPIAVAGAVYLFWSFLLKLRSTGYLLGAPANETLPESASEADYTRVFPPSQRHVLSGLAPDIVRDSKSLSTPGIQLLGLESHYKLANSSTYVYSGFTIGEITSLGHFPDYAKLSGFPAPTPLANFNIDAARPRPYRPFRWPYHQTMCKYKKPIRVYISPLTVMPTLALTKLDHNYWLELESTYRERITQRRSLYDQHGKAILQALPGSELACKELTEMALQFLSLRYPQSFNIRGTVFVNNILGTSHDVRVCDPLHVLLENLPEDFGIMMRDEKTGRYHLRAGVICSSLGWKLGEKIGMGLSGVHQAVPSYKEKMAFSMDR